MVLRHSQRRGVLCKICVSQDTGLKVRGNFCECYTQILESLYLSFLFKDLTGKDSVHQSEIDSTWKDLESRTIPVTKAVQVDMELGHPIQRMEGSICAKATEFSLKYLGTAQISVQVWGDTVQSKGHSSHCNCWKGQWDFKGRKETEGKYQKTLSEGSGHQTEFWGPYFPPLNRNWFELVKVRILKMTEAMSTHLVKTRNIVPFFDSPNYPLTLSFSRFNPLARPVCSIPHMYLLCINIPSPLSSLTGTPNSNPDSTLSPLSSLYTIPRIFCENIIQVT